MYIISDNTPFLEAALRYASLGFRVFPCHGFIACICSCCRKCEKPGKHPATEHGCRDGTTDEDRIRQWWTEKPWANIGSAMDAHHLGLDKDIATGGEATLSAWVAEHGPLPQTPHAKTGSGGDHWYFTLPSGVIVKSRAGVAPGIDTRSAGGYLIAPPSLHQSGGRYQWLTPLSEPLAMAPDWLIDIVADKTATTPTPSADGEFAIAIGDDEPNDFALHPGSGQGHRRQALLRLVGIHLDRGDSVKSIEAMALAWAKRCDPPCEPKGIMRTVRDLAKADAAKRGLDGKGRVGVGVDALASGTRHGMEAKGVAPASGGLPSIPCHNFQAESDGTEAKAGDLASIPFHAEGEGDNAEGESLHPDPPPPFPSTHKEDILYLTKNIVANANPPEGAWEGCAQSQELKAEVGAMGDEPEGFCIFIGEGSADGDEAKAPMPGIAFESVTIDAKADGEGEGSSVCDTADDWPLLGAEAYHGLAGQIVGTIAPETEADPSGLLLTLLTAYGNAVGNGPHYAMMDGEHHANLFAALVGDTASGKGRAWSIVKRLMEKADPALSQSISYGLSSGEGLVDRVKDEGDKPNDEDGDFCISIPSPKRLLCVEAEFARPITAMRREGNTLSALLRSAWDGQTLEVLTRGKSKLRASGAHVSLIAHITPEELAKLLANSVEVANGFSNRFLWGMVKRSRLLPHGGDPGVLDAFVGPMTDAIAEGRIRGRLLRTDEANGLWEAEYEALTSAKPGAFGMATSRAHAQTLRLSLLYALLDKSPTIGIEHLQAALALWRYCEASAGRIFGQAQASAGTVSREGDAGDGPLDLRLWHSICKAPGITRNALLQSLPSNKRGLLGEALAKLEAQRLAHRRPVPTSGRPAEGWFPGPKPDGPDEGDGDKTSGMEWKVSPQGLRTRILGDLGQYTQ